MADNFLGLKNAVSKEIKLIREFIKIFGDFEKEKNQEEKNKINFHINELKKSILNENAVIKHIANSVSLAKPLGVQKNSGGPAEKEKSDDILFGDSEMKELHADERVTLRRMKKEQEETREKLKKEKEKKKGSQEYAKFANRFFSKTSKELVKKGSFKTLEKELIKANLPYTPTGYVSIIFFTTFIALLVSLFLMLFFLFFNLEATMPFITPMQESFATRIPKVIWIIFVFPIAAFLFAYLYPTMERKSIEGKIENELPFATIHMASISGSMIDPSKTFDIIISTKEYPFLEKEFKKLMNEINVYGYDFVSALRNISANSPSAKLSELFNGLATTINSGGNLPEFFNKRADTLLFEHKIKREKETKAAETFMDIYISIVIAAPMVLMLLLMMMKISGLGISLSTGMITLVMVLGVSIINIIFMVFLHMKKTE